MPDLATAIARGALPIIVAGKALFFALLGADGEWGLAVFLATLGLFEFARYASPRGPRDWYLGVVAGLAAEFGLVLSRGPALGFTVVGFTIACVGLQDWAYRAAGEKVRREIAGEAPVVDFGTGLGILLKDINLQIALAVGLVGVFDLVSRREVLGLDAALIGLCAFGVASSLWQQSRRRRQRFRWLFPVATCTAYALTAGIVYALAVAFFRAWASA